MIKKEVNVIDSISSKLLVKTIAIHDRIDELKTYEDEAAFIDTIEKQWLTYLEDCNKEITKNCAEYLVGIDAYLEPLRLLKKIAEDERKEKDVDRKES
jgi:hypothetical protein